MKRKIWNKVVVSKFSGKKSFQRVEELRNGRWLGQLSSNEYVPTKDGYIRESVDHVLYHFATVEEALDAVGYPHYFCGIPEELKTK